MKRDDRHFNTKRCFLLILLIGTLATILTVKNSFLGAKDKYPLRARIGRHNNHIYEERLQHLHYECSKLKTINTQDIWDNKEVLNHILVDKQNGLLYCYVPKVACTNWKRIFMILTGRTNITDPVMIPAQDAHNRSNHLFLSNYTSSEISYLLSSYKKFLFVRHPFERLLSAFRNKLEPKLLRSKYFLNRVGKYIVSKQRPEGNSSVSESNISFSDFVSYIVDTVSRGFNEHWTPINTLCEPCLIAYDFVGKYESLLDDSSFILNNLAPVDNLHFPTFHPSNTSGLIQKYFSALSVETILRLYKIYEADFKLFSYSLEEIFGYELF